MSCMVIIGTQWGDEGKAKMIDFFSATADIIIRYQGGANAGHTVVANGVKHVFHLIPSGILHADKVCLIGNGVVLDPDQLIAELDSLERQGIDAKPRLLISESAHLILPYHKIFDEVMEESRSNKIGTTKRGIGPCYADKALRIGIRVGDLFDDEFLTARVKTALDMKNPQLEKIYKRPPVSESDILASLREFRDRIQGNVINTQHYIYQAIKKNKKILLEGAQGVALDIDHGTYPYVTSSNTTIGGALTGTGLSPFNIDRIVGITKAYVTRVGEGPFPTEDSGEDGNILRKRGDEYGSTTGRPRRCGWFDVEVMKYSKSVNGLTSLALTKLDVLSGFKKIKVSVAYEINGKKLEHFPSSGHHRIKPVYENLDGWTEDISACRSFEELPSAAKTYIGFISKSLDIPISVVSVGPDRSNTFLLN